MSTSRPSVAESNRRRAVPLPIRFSSRVDKDGPPYKCLGKCWLWKGRLTEGYGHLYCKGIFTGVHRISYQLHVGPIPKGLLVCHHCDVRHCVNPEHLFVGTDSDNAKDKTAKGRQSRLRGDRNGRAKLTPSQVKYIRSVYKRGDRGRGSGALARELGVSDVAVLLVVRGKTW